MASCHRKQNYFSLKRIWFTHWLKRLRKPIVTSRAFWDVTNRLSHVSCGISLSQTPGASLIRPSERDKMILRPFHVHNGTDLTGMATSWIRALDTNNVLECGFLALSPLTEIKISQFALMKIVNLQVNLMIHLYEEKQHNNPDSKAHGANMGPICGRHDPGGPHVVPTNLAIWEVPILHECYFCDSKSYTFLYRTSVNAPWPAVVSRHSIDV